MLHRSLPVSERAFGARASGVPRVLLYQPPQNLALAKFGHVRELNQTHVTLSFQLTELVQHVRHSAAHSGTKVTTGAPKHDDCTSGHVLAAVIANAFHYCDRSTVPHREPLAGDSSEIRFA